MVESSSPPQAIEPASDHATHVPNPSDNHTTNGNNECKNPSSNNQHGPSNRRDDCDLYYGDKRTRSVYLTADSDCILTELDSSCIYIIGGLVDRNRYPCITAQRAQLWNIGTARLPIQDYCQLGGSNILTVDQGTNS